jgi:hypothetical protein
MAGPLKIGLIFGGFVSWAAGSNKIFVARTTILSLRACLVCLSLFVEPPRMLLM